jgi:hypothetical protein
VRAGARPNAYVGRQLTGSSARPYCGHSPICRM